MRCYMNRGKIWWRQKNLWRTKKLKNCRKWRTPDSLRNRLRRLLSRRRKRSLERFSVCWTVMMMDLSPPRRSISVFCLLKSSRSSPLYSVRWKRWTRLSMLMNLQMLLNDFTRLLLYLTKTSFLPSVRNGSRNGSSYYLHTHFSLTWTRTQWD